MVRWKNFVYSLRTAQRTDVLGKSQKRQTRRVFVWTSIIGEQGAVEKSENREKSATLFRVLRKYVARGAVSPSPSFHRYTLAINRILSRPVSMKIEIFAADTAATNVSLALCVYDCRPNALHDRTEPILSAPIAIASARVQLEQGSRLECSHCFRTRMLHGVMARCNPFLFLFCIFICRGNAKQRSTRLCLMFDFLSSVPSPCIHACLIVNMG